MLRIVFGIFFGRWSEKLSEIRPPLMVTKYYRNMSLPAAALIHCETIVKNGKFDSNIVWNEIVLR